VSLGVLGAGFGVLPSGRAPAGGYAPLCLFTQDGGPTATEFAWDGARYLPGARYKPEAGAGRPRERALLGAGM
jgi:hypothetical protein